MNRSAAVCLAAYLAVVLPAGPARAADPQPFDATLFDTFTARPLGPSNMGGRIVDVAVVESRPSTMYVATASGGLWKTVNNGTTFMPVFDAQSTVSIGDVAVAPSDPNVVWVGTGEANARNSVSWGDGVYKSTDGGKTWAPMGLKETQHIGRIVIHPKNPDVVVVAALGHLWGPNKERGLYRTADGGKTWEQVKYLNEDTGFIDLVLDPSEPDTLYAAACAVRRDGFAGGNPAKQFSPEAGLYKSGDGGKTWDRMTRGLPTRSMGRCGLDVYRKDPRILYAVVQTDKTDTRSVPGQVPKAGGDVETGGIYRSDDKGQSWTKVNDLCPRPFYFGQVRVDPSDDKRVYVLGVSLFASSDGGKTFRTDVGGGAHPDHHALWIDPQDSSHLVLGNDGGLYFSYDRAATWEHLLNLPIGQFYAVAVDMRKPYRVYGGLQDNGSWGGPSATRSGEGITVADWARIMGADGFQCQVDPTDPDTVYAESQYGGLGRINVRTGDSSSIRPRPPQGAPAYRFNWNAPILLSPHNPRTLYYGGNHLFRSVDRGDNWEVISPDLTRGKPGPSPDNGHTITTIAESPLKAGLVYVGTDDGRVHVTRNGGGEWTDLSEKVPGVPADRWITRVECSRFNEGTAYLALDRHRNDDRKPYLFKTSDYGATWKPASAGLPDNGPVHVVREDRRNKDLLFAGTEFGLYVSLDAGASWQRLKAGLPTVAVHDLVIHPRDRELVLATHGRSIWVLDVAPLEELNDKVLASAAHLFDVKPATAAALGRPPHGITGTASRLYAAPNPPPASFFYYLKEKPAQPVKLTVSDALGNAKVTMTGADSAGLHRLTWNLRAAVGVGPARFTQLVEPGDYVVKLEVGDRTVMTKRLRVEAEE